MSSRTWSRWQSIAETVALVVMACGVARVALVKPMATASVGAITPPGAKHAEPPLPADPVSLTGAQVAGSPTAKIAMVVYSDFQCPFCGKFARETLPAIQDQYVKTGKVLLAFREYPLPIHPFAQKAAEAALCAGRQGKFWEFHDDLFANQQALDPVSLSARAAQLGLETGPFASCLKGQTAALVQADRTGGGPLGIAGTPTFLVGRLLADGRMKVTQRFSGAKPVAAFQAILDELVGAPSGPGGHDEP